MAAPAVARLSSTLDPTALPRRRSEISDSDSDGSQGSSSEELQDRRPAVSARVKPSARRGKRGHVEVYKSADGSCIMVYGNKVYHMEAGDVQAPAPNISVLARHPRATSPTTSTDSSAEGDGGADPAGARHESAENAVVAAPGAVIGDAVVNARRARDTRSGHAGHAGHVGHARRQKQVVKKANRQRPRKRQRGLDGNVADIGPEPAAAPAEDAEQARHVRAPHANSQPANVDNMCANLQALQTCLPAIVSRSMHDPIGLWTRIQRRGDRIAEGDDFRWGSGRDGIWCQVYFAHKQDSTLGTVFKADVRVLKHTCTMVDGTTINLCVYPDLCFTSLSRLYEFADVVQYMYTVLKEKQPLDTSRAAASFLDLLQKAKRDKSLDMAFYEGMSRLAARDLRSFSRNGWKLKVRTCPPSTGIKSVHCTSLNLLVPPSIRRGLELLTPETIKQCLSSSTVQSPSLAVLVGT